MKIKQISMQAFRGFPGLRTFDISDSVTMVYALNGCGKTSIAEAFEWTLFGDIARRERSRTTSEFGRGFGFLRSVHAEDSVPTWAEVVLEDKDDKEYKIRRIVNGTETKLLVNDVETETLDDIGISQGTRHKPCLGQSEIKAFIDTQPIERWDQISAILGLDQFGVLRAKLQGVRAEIENDERVRRLRNSVTSAVAPFAKDGQDPVHSKPDDLLKETAEALGLKADFSWEKIKELATGKEKHLLNKDSKPKGFAVLDNENDELEISELKELINTNLAQLPEHRKLHAKNSKMRFVSEGLELAEPPVCPFCEQKTLTQEQLAKLREASKQSGYEQKSNHHDISTNFRIIKELASAKIPDELIGALNDALPDDFAERKKLTEIIDNQNSLNKKVLELDALISGLVKKFDPSKSDPVEEIKTVVDEVNSKLEELSTAYQSFWTSCKEIKQAAELVLSGLGDNERIALRSLQSIINLAEKIPDVTRSWRLLIFQDEISKLVTRLESKEKEVVKANLNDLAEDVIKYYNQINKDATLEFKGFQVKDGVRRQASLNATSFGQPVNPTSMFSEAQSNSLGLSLYFSQRVDRNPAWDSIMLDDPVQSMDEAHKEDLISLLGSLSETKQIIVFTHDRAFKQSLENEFSGSGRLMKYEIIKNESNPEPRVDLQEARYDQLSGYAQSLSNGGEIELEEACGTMRRGVERLITDSHIARGNNPPRRGSIEDKINALNFMPEPKRAKLHRARSYGTRGSHDSSDPISGSGIRTLINEMDNIYKEFVSDVAS